MATSTAPTAHGYALLIAADPPVRRGALPATTVLPQLAAVPPAHLVGAAYASAVQLANPDDPNTVLTHIRTAAGVEGPLFIYLAGHLQVDARQGRPHLALARTAPRTVRYTALPWHWLAAELQHRAPGSTTVVADLAAAPEVWQQLGAGQLLLSGPFLLYGTVQRTDKRSRPQPAYSQALAQALRAAHQRPGTEELHAHVARTAALDGAATLWLGGVPAADGTPGGWPAGAPAVTPAAGSAPVAPGAPEAFVPADNGAPAAARYDAPVAGHDVPVVEYGAPRAEYGGPVPEYDASVLEYSAPVLAYGAVAPEPGPAAAAAAAPEPTPEPDDYELAPAATPASPAVTPPEAPEPPETASSETPEMVSSETPEVQLSKAPEAQRSEVSEAATPPAPEEVRSEASETPAATPVPLPPMPARPPIPVVAAIPPVPGAAPVEEPHHAVFAAAAAGRHGEAAAMAAAWEQAALRSHGPVSPEAVHWIEVQAELARQAEEPVRASGLWMRSAHVRLAGGQNATDPEVTAAVDRAHHCWHQVSDRDSIRDLGVELANLRGRVPGKSGAIDDVQRRLAQLTETANR
ncbi:hypothetical protein [Streptomyces sp. NPDC053560]|uniref:hypothetical protein n=1 Tax=Streptomyces sp. NPDC053560 TaxID=3365711 RepID=UPI0037D3B9E0